MFCYVTFSFESIIIITIILKGQIVLRCVLCSCKKCAITLKGTPLAKNLSGCFNILTAALCCKLSPWLVFISVWPFHSVPCCGKISILNPRVQHQNTLLKPAGLKGHKYEGGTEKTAEPWAHELFLFHFIFFSLGSGLMWLSLISFWVCLVVLRELHGPQGNMRWREKGVDEGETEAEGGGRRAANTRAT